MDSILESLQGEGQGKFLLQQLPDGTHGYVIGGGSPIKDVSKQIEEVG